MCIKANIVLLVGLVFWSIPFAEAEQQGTVPKIAWLTPRINYRFEEFLRELRKLGYVDGKNVSFVTRSFGSEFGRLPALAEELVGLKVDVIVTRGTPETVALKKTTKTIPIVFYSVTDPIGSGLVDSMARPLGNITGFTTTRRCWQANDWSYSRKPCQNSPVSRCCGILRTVAPCNSGKKANRRHGHLDCNFIPWK
jgi:ABC-type uncharacterized transport system substrate-binding protein